MSKPGKINGVGFWVQGMTTALRDASLIALGCAALGVAVNLFHPQRIPYIAEQEYETLVPCPEPGGEVTPIDPSDLALGASYSFLVDARSADSVSKWKYQNAMNMPFDYLDPTPEEAIQELARSIARSRARRVVIYGDGDTPDSGEQLGREISGKGIKNVFYIQGGAPALRQATQSKKEAKP